MNSTRTDAFMISSLVSTALDKRKAQETIPGPSTPSENCRAIHARRPLALARRAPGAAALRT